MYCPVERELGAAEWDGMDGDGGGSKFSVAAEAKLACICVILQCVVGFDVIRLHLTICGVLYKKYQSQSVMIGQQCLHGSTMGDPIEVPLNSHHFADTINCDDNILYTQCILIVGFIYHICLPLELCKR